MRTFATVLAVLAVSLTFAQGAGPGGGQGRPGGGQGRMGQGMMLENRVTLLMRPDVQQELKITPEQREKIQAAMPQRQQGGGQAGAGQQGGGQAGAGQGRGQGGGFGGGQAGQGDQFAEIVVTIKKILTPEQWDRLTGLYIQRVGNIAVMDQEIAKAINLTDSQRASIQQAQQEQRQKMMEMMQEARQNGGNMAAMAEMRTKMQAEMNETIGGILSTEQKAKLREMRGEPFTFQGGGAGRGGVGGRGGAGGGAGARGGAGGGGN